MDEEEKEEEEEDVKPDINQLNNVTPPVKPHYWIYQVGYPHSFHWKHKVIGYYSLKYNYAKTTFIL